MADGWWTTPVAAVQTEGDKKMVTYYVSGRRRRWSKTDDCFRFLEISGQKKQCLLFMFLFLRKVFCFVETLFFKRY